MSHTTTASTPTDQSPAPRDDIQRLERQIADLKAALDRHEHELEVQMLRTAQVQADMDLIQSAWSTIRSSR
jgi:hypothetical protein